MNSMHIPALFFSNTRIMVFKGMVFKSKYWILEKIKGIFLSEYLNFEELKGSHKGVQYWISFKLQLCCRFWQQLLVASDEKPVN